MIRIGMLAVALLSVVGPAHACDRSDVALDYFAVSDGAYEVGVTVCVGGGRDGYIRGADSDTREVLFAFATPGNVPVNVLSFSPEQIAGDVTGGTYLGIDVGPQMLVGPQCDDGYGQMCWFAAVIAYLDTSGAGVPFTCIHSPDDCGMPHSQCMELSFTLDVRPEVMQVYGLEGSGNVHAGCFPNPDTRIWFDAATPAVDVRWGAVKARFGDGEG